MPIEMPTQARMGRLLVLAAFAVTIVGDLIVITVVSKRMGASPSIGSMVRPLLTVALFYGIWRGAAWARWLVVCLLSVGLLLVLLPLLRVGMNPFLLGVALQFLVAVGLLAFPPSVGAFLNYQRAQYRENT